MTTKNPFQPAAPSRLLKVLLFGTSGSGKTLAALTFPGVAFIDAEAGSDAYARIAEVADFEVIHTKSLADVDQAIQFIQSGASGFETLVVDPITVFYDMLKDTARQSAKKGLMGMPEWNQVNNRMNALYNTLTSCPVNVVICAREANEYEGEGLALRKVGPKAAADRNLPYMFDFIVRMNPDYSGTVVKARSLQVRRGTVLPQVSWETLCAAASQPAITTGVTEVKIVHQGDKKWVEAGDVRFWSRQAFRDAGYSADEWDQPGIYSLKDVPFTVFWKANAKGFKEGVKVEAE